MQNIETGKDGSCKIFALQEFQEERREKQAEYLEKHGWEFKNGVWQDPLGNLRFPLLKQALEIQRIRDEIDRELRR